MAGRSGDWAGLVVAGGRAQSSRVLGTESVELRVKGLLLPSTTNAGFHLSAEAP